MSYLQIEKLNKIFVNWIIFNKFISNKFNYMSDQSPSLKIIILFANFCK